MLKLGLSLVWAAHRPVSGGGGAVAEMPVISRGLPYSASSAGGFGGTNAESNAIDTDYGTTWNSVFSPNSTGKEWFVLDLRTVAAGDKTSVWFNWKNRHGNYYEASATLGSDAASVFNGLPRNYKLQGHTSSGSEPGVADAGWTDLVTVTDNRYNERIHTGLNLSTYNWFRFYCTASSGVTGATDSVEIEFDLRDVSAGSDDAIFFYGDSICSEAFNVREPGNTVWASPGPLQNALEDLTGRAAPIVINGGVGGWMASTGDTNKADYIGANDCKYVALCFGTNDANNAGVDLTGSGGTSSAYALAVKASFQSMIDYAVGLGKTCIIPYIPYGNVSAWSAPNVAILNSIIDEVIAANPGDVLLGPDAYSFFAAHTNCLRDSIHPTYDDSVGAGLYNGMTGYENLIALWRDRLATLLY